MRVRTKVKYIIYLDRSASASFMKNVTSIRVAHFRKFLTLSEYLSNFERYFCSRKFSRN